MKTGALLKTKTGLDKNRDEFFFLYDKPGGKKIGSVKEATIVGTYDRSQKDLLTTYLYVKLATPLSGGYRYAFIRENAVFEYSPNKTTYYVNTKTAKLNVRSSATAASSKNIIGTLSRNQLVGTSDGTLSNGFLLFELAKGGTGWVSKNFLTTTRPAGTAAPTTTTTTDQDPVTDPAEQSTVSKLATATENRFGDGSLKILLWVGIGLVAVAVGIGLAKYYERKNAKRSSGK